jgi:hypothetical protein
MLVEGLRLPPRAPLLIGGHGMKLSFRHSMHQRERRALVAALALVAVRLVAVPFTTSAASAQQEPEQWITMSNPLSTPAGLFDGDFTQGFQAVSCLSTTFCMAGGRNATGQPVIETFDGTTWSTSWSDNVLLGQVEGISCISVSFLCRRWKA